MLSLSNGTYLGKEFSGICDTVSRRVNGSCGKKRAIDRRDNYIGQTLNRLDWKGTQTLVVEDLKNLKLGKRKNRSKAFRRRLSSWTYAKVIKRIQDKALENRVRLVAVPPQYTSQTCPTCSYVDSKNRHNEDFQCLQCGYSADADYVGALNILNGYSRSLKSLAAA